MDAIRFYSKRLLNPFNGLAQIIETQNARAISTDGISWRLQIRTAIYKMPWRSLVFPHHYDQYFVYGVWSRSEGITRVPIHPTLYEEHVESDADALICALDKYSQAVPFKYQDKIELWLLDLGRRKPFVLIDSRIDDKELSIPTNISWLPCTMDDNSLITSAFPTRQQNATIPVHAKDILSALVKDRVGPKPIAAWIQRNEDLDGRVLSTNSHQLNMDNMVISGTEFPDYFLYSDWEDKETQTLFDDYIIWLAPLLLTLPTIEGEKRCELENFSRRRPIEVLKHHRLYPEICDQTLMNSILVEAKLRLARDDALY